MGTGNYLDTLILGSNTVTANAAVKQVAGASASFAAGTAVMSTNGQVTKAISSALPLGLYPAGLAITSGSAGTSVTIITQGPIDPSVKTLGAGVACAVGVDSSGNPVRITDATCVSGIAVLGSCDATGAIFVSPYLATTINIAAFGAVGDDSTINTAVIQAALNAAPSGADVLVPAGIFRTGALSVPRGIVIRGGGLKSILSITGSVSGLTIDATLSGYGNMVIRDLVVQSVAGQTPTRGIYIINNYHTTLHNVHVMSSDAGGWSVAALEITGTGVGPGNSAAVALEQTELYNAAGAGLLISNTNASQNVNIVIDHACEIHANRNGGIVSTSTPFAKITIESGAIVEGNLNHQIRGNFGGGSLIGGYFEIPSLGDSNNAHIAIDTYQGVAIRGAYFTRGGYGGAHDYFITAGAIPATGCDGLTIEDNWFGGADVAACHLVSGDNVRWGKQRNNGAPTDLDITPDAISGLIYQNSPFDAGDGVVQRSTTGTTLTYDQETIVSTAATEAIYTLPNVRLWFKGGKRYRFKNRQAQGALIVTADANSLGIDGVKTRFARNPGDCIEVVSTLEANGTTWSWNVVDPVIRETDPRELTNNVCVWYLDATIGLTLSGGRVSAWADQSGVGDANENATQGTSGARPLWTEFDGQYNGEATISNDDGARWMVTGTWGNGLSSQTFSVITIGECTNTMWSTYPASSNFVSLDITGVAWRMYAGTAQSLVTTSLKKSIVTTVFAGASSKGLVNTTATNTIAGNPGTNAQFGVFPIGILAATNGSGKGVGDKIAWAAAFAGDVTADPLYSRLITSLARRYGVVLT